MCNDASRRVYRKRKSNDWKCRVQTTHRVASEGGGSHQDEPDRREPAGQARSESDPVSALGAGLGAPSLIARLHQLAADPATLVHRLGRPPSLPVISVDWGP